MSVRTGSVQQFLLIYNRKRDELLSRESFGDNTVIATIVYRVAEIEYQDHPKMGIVLIGAESLETIRVTRSTYFTGLTTYLLDEIHAGMN